jgi:photosystem II stability/assembly factor-like uncharacterized protein
MNSDEQLEERLGRLSWPVDRGRGWAGIESLADVRTGGLRRPSASTRWSGLRVAVLASIAIVLVASAAIGGFVAVRNLARPHFVLAITDDNVVGTGGQTTGSSTGSGYWERLPLTIPGVPIDTLIMDPSNPSVLYARTAAGLFESSDGAASWHQTLSFSAFVGQVFAVAFDPASPSTVYMIALLSGDSPWPTQLLRSDDGGVTWTHLTDASTPKPSGWFAAIWFDAASTPSTVFMWGNNGSGDDGWYRSTDRGETWTGPTEEEADQAITIRHLPAAAQQALDAFLVSFSGTVTDADTGAVVGVVPGNNGVMSGAPTGTAAGSVIVDPDQPSTFYAPTMNGVYKSTDSGRSWRKAGTDPGNPAVGSVLVDPRTPSTLYAGTSDGIFQSTDGGAGWTLIREGAGCVGLAPSNPSRLYAWTTTGLVRSDDGGEKWSGLTGEGLGGPPESALLSVAADNPDVVFATPKGPASLTGSEGGLSRSTDGGNTWSEVLERATLVVADPKTPSTLFAAASSRVFKSTDIGATWTVVSPRQWVDEVVDIAVDPHNPSNVYAVQCSDAGAYSVSRSVDGGATWQKVRLEGPAKYIRQLLFDPRSPDTLYVLTFQVVESVVAAGVYRSTDGGATWENIIGKLPATGYVSIVIDPASTKGLYATTTGGLFKWVQSSE